VGDEGRRSVTLCFRPQRKRKRYEERAATCLKALLPKCRPRKGEGTRAPLELRQEEKCLFKVEGPYMCRKEGGDKVFCSKVLYTPLDWGMGETGGRRGKKEGGGLSLREMATG